MLGLREYRKSADRLADHLPWAAFVAPGIVLNKDGSFQRTFGFQLATRAIDRDWVGDRSAAGMSQ